LADQAYKVLIPTDFSEHSWNAVKKAIQLFWDKPTIFHFIHAYKPHIARRRFSASALSLEDMQERPKRIAIEKLEARVEKIKDEFSNKHHTYSTHASFETLKNAVLHILTEIDIDLIVMGTKGASAIEYSLIGSNTHKLIQANTSCPLLAIPRQCDIDKINTIGFALDIKRSITPQQLKPLIDIASLLSAKIKVVYVKKPNDSFTESQFMQLKKLKNAYRDIAFDFKGMLEVKSVSKTLELYAEEEKIDVLALMNYNYGYIENMSKAEVVKKTLFESFIPILVVSDQIETQLKTASSKEKHTVQS
jgi:nucleotide-binding universal stress UspA family protein